MIVNILFVWPICIPQKLGLQYILVGLCLVLFHSVGDHWQDKGVEIGELCNIIFFLDFWYQQTQVVTGFKWEIYCRILFAYLLYPLIIINRAAMG